MQQKLEIEEIIKDISLLDDIIYNCLQQVNNNIDDRYDAKVNLLITYLKAIDAVFTKNNISIYKELNYD